jgi:hypothetical protein
LRRFQGGDNFPALSFSIKQCKALVTRSRILKTGECIYCGKLGALTADHIPPKNLFPRPRPSNLITVPSCHKCNKGFELDDEYFRFAVTTGIDGAAFPRELALSIEAINKLKDTKKIRFAQKMLASRTRESVYTPAGIYLGEAWALNIDAARVEKVVSRVIRGLFYSHSEKRLPEFKQIVIRSNWPGWNSGSNSEDVAAWKEIFDALCSVQMRVISEGVFRYSYIMDDEVPSGSAWWLSFYEHRNFLGVTL